MVEEKIPAGETVDTETATPPTPLADQSPAVDSSKDLTVKVQSLEKQITDVATENATLRQRLTELEATPEEEVITAPPVPSSAEIDAIAELSETNPREAFKKMAELHSRQLHQSQATAQKQRVQENQFLAYVNDIYAKDPDLKPYDDFLGAAARQLITQGVNPYKAVNAVVEDFKKKLKVAKPTVSESATRLPSGARGETGSNLPPPKEPPPEKEETTGDVVNAREEYRRKKIMKATK